MEHKPTIMVVDDDGDLRDAVCDLLRQDGFEVLTAENGQEGLAHLRAHPHVRAVVLDVEMPVMNGATFRGEQLADPTIAAIPTILMTARRDLVPLGLALQASAWLQKPFTPHALLCFVDLYR